MNPNHEPRPDQETESRVSAWLADTDLGPDEADRGLERLLKEFPTTPQARYRFLGRWFDRDEGARRRTDGHDHPLDTNRRNRLMFSATGLMAAFAILALTVNVVNTSDPAPPQAGAGATHVVATDGSGQYSTIAEAVEAASDGDTISVQPGTYVEAILIDKNITLTGDGPVEDIVITAPEGGPTSGGDPSDFYALLLQDAGDATVSGLTFRGEPSIVVVSGGSPTIQDSTFAAVGWAFGTRGLSFGGSSIHVNDGSTATIVGNSLVDGGPVGVFGESTPTVSNNTFSGGPHIFLSSFGDGTVIADNKIDGTLRRAINVSDAGEVEITGNTISDPGSEGIRLKAGTALVADNEVSGAGTGIVAIGLARVRAVANLLTGNDTGINGSGFDLVRDNELRDGQVGMVLGGEGPLVEGNVVEGHEAVGIRIGPGSSPTLSANRVCGNAPNLIIAEGATPILDGTNEICEDAPAE
jgi:nitrous oxidase accessory protein NosD